MDINIQKVILSLKLHISHRMRPYSSVIQGSSYTCFRGHSMPIYQMIQWMIPQIFLKLKPSDAFMKKCSPENFSFILHMVQKLSYLEFCQKSVKIAYCQLQARFFQIWCQRTCQGKKTVTVNIGPHRVFHPNEPFLPSEKCIFRSTRELFGEVWNKYQSSKLLLILSTSYVNILLILIQLLYNSRFYSRLYFKNVL